MAATAEEPAVEFADGDHVGTYRIDDRIGIGGMGAVYRAAHSEDGHTVALKIMHADQLEYPSSIDRMIREAQILGSIKHAGLPHLFETGMLDERPWIAMELVEGTPLATRLSRGVMAPDEVLAFIEGVAEVLAAAHAVGITHRDLKPDNVFLTPDASHAVSVIDWGIAHEQQGARYTNLNEAIGTPTYMAPEQARGAPTDGRADVYGLGVVAFRALTGRAPFIGGSAVEILVQHLNKPPPALAPRCPDAPIGLVELVEKMLIKNVDDRPNAAAVVAMCRSLRGAAEPDYDLVEIEIPEHIVDVPTEQMRKPPRLA